MSPQSVRGVNAYPLSRLRRKRLNTRAAPMIDIYSKDAFPLNYFLLPQPWPPSGFISLTASKSTSQDTHSDHPAVQHEAFLLGHEDTPMILALHRRLKRSFMQIRIKLFPVLAGVKSFKSMLLECLHQNCLRHF